MTFEHPWINAGFEYIDAKDRPTLADHEAHAKGWSVFATPRTPIGVEVLFRHDHLEPDADANDSEKTRTIAGVAWWFAFKPGITTAVLADHEQVRYTDFSPGRPTEKRWALHLLLAY